MELELDDADADRAAARLVVGLSFPGAAGSYGTDGQRQAFGDEPLLAALASRTLVHMRDDGTTLGYAFATFAGVALGHWLR